MLVPVKDLGELDTPLVVFGGPYSNLAATESLLNRIDQSQIPPSQVICTGDVVAYSADAEATSQLIRQSGIHVVMGNCEESLAEDATDCGCGFEPGMKCSALSEQWFTHARQQVSVETRSWMASLPRIIRFKLQGLSFCALHGSADRINQFIFESTDLDQKQTIVDDCQADVVLAGHCGLSFGQALARGFWLNAGVIGLPANDGQRSTCYMLLQHRDGQLDASWHALHYDAESSYRAMKDAGLNDYASTLLNGCWPSMDVLPAPERSRQGQPWMPTPIRLA